MVEMHEQFPLLQSRGDQSKRRRATPAILFAVVGVVVVCLFSVRSQIKRLTLVQMVEVNPSLQFVPTDPQANSTLLRY